MADYSVSSTQHRNLVALLAADPGSRIAILDANLVVLFVASLVQVDLFPSFKRIRSFSKADARILSAVLSRFRSVATNAYVLAESSNLANELSGFRRNLWFEALARYAAATVEIHVGTKNLAESPMLVTFGVTDAALGSLPDGYVLVTADGPMFGYLSGVGKDVLNFNHLLRF